MTLSIKYKLKFSFGKKLPIILQTEATECGLACIAMIATYHGYEIDLLTIRNQYPISLQGSALKDLIDISKNFNLSARAVRLDLEDLRNLRTPCILHWDMNHFVVLEKVGANNAIIHDPAIGINKYKIKEVSKYFTGVAMELLPTKEFYKKKDITRLYLSDLCSTIFGLKTSIVQIVLITIALEIFAIVSPLYIQLTTDNVVASRDLPLIYVLACGFGMLTILQVLTSYFRSWVIIYLSNTLNVQLASNLIRHLFKLPIDFFEKRHMGDIISRFSSLSTIQDKISKDFVESIIDGVMVIATLGMMLIYSKSLSSVVFIALFLYVIVRVFLYKAIKLQTQEALNTTAKENSIFMESIRAILPLKIFRKEAIRENMWKNSYIDKLNAHIKLSKLELTYQSIHKIIFGIEYVVIVLFGAIFIINNEFSIGMLFAYIFYRQQFISKSQNIVDKIVEYKIVGLHLERVADIALSAPEKDLKGVKFNEIKGSIEVRNLFFRYSDQTPYIIKNLNFKINAGESVAIVGASGCGKTTLVKIMLSLLTPTSGEVLVDGINLQKLGIQPYRSQVAAVMQEDVLMSGSVTDNISFFDDDLNLKKVINSAKIASIHDDISQLIMGYETLIRNMGTTFSGGQKQRILLARALYKDPKILFLDEATSHLDVSNEKIINFNIKKINITRVIIAHRQETIESADRVISLS